MKTIFRFYPFILLNLITFFYLDTVYAKHDNKAPKDTIRIDRESLRSYLLPEDHPLAPKLKSLFKNPKMFKSPKNFRQEGFQLRFGHRQLMVAYHPEIGDYLIKKFPDSTPKERQIENYLRRIDGANTVRKYIESNQLKHILVPQKWLYRTPYGYVLIVEKMDIFELAETNRRYKQIDIETLTELCQVLHAVGGCDAFSRNQPFTKSGQVAFVDTEHVGKKKDAFHRHILPLLTPEKKEYALALWDNLEHKNK